MIFLASVSLSSLSLDRRPLGTIAEVDAFAADCRYRTRGEGVVAEDDGVAMAAGRVARKATSVADVVEVGGGWATGDGRGGGRGWGVGDV